MPSNPEPPLPFAIIPCDPDSYCEHCSSPAILTTIPLTNDMLLSDDTNDHISLCAPCAMTNTLTLIDDYRLAPIPTHEPSLQPDANDTDALIAAQPLILDILRSMLESDDADSAELLHFAQMLRRNDDAISAN